MSSETPVPPVAETPANPSPPALAEVAETVAVPPALTKIALPFAALAVPPATFTFPCVAALIAVALSPLVATLPLLAIFFVLWRILRADYGWAAKPYAVTHTQRLGTDMVEVTLHPGTTWSPKKGS